MSNGLPDKVVEAYLETLREEISIEAHNGYCIATLPFVTASGHLVEIRIRELEGGYIALSDMNNQISDLWLSGVNVRGRKRKLVEHIISQYNLRIEGEEIIALAKQSEVGMVFNAMAQALLRIGDLRFFHVLSQIREVSIPKKIKGLLEKAKLEYVKGIHAILPGQVGTYQFDFIVFRNGYKSPIKSLESKQPKVLRTFVEASTFEFYQIKRVDSSLLSLGIYDKENELWEKDKELLEIARLYAKMIPIQNEDEIMNTLSSNRN